MLVKNLIDNENFNKVCLHLWSSLCTITYKDSCRYNPMANLGWSVRYQKIFIKFQMKVIKFLSPCYNSMFVLNLSLRPPVSRVSDSNWHCKSPAVFRVLAGQSFVAYNPLSWCRVEAWTSIDSGWWNYSLVNVVLTIEVQQSRWPFWMKGFSPHIVTKSKKKIWRKHVKLCTHQCYCWVPTTGKWQPYGIQG